MAQDQLVEERLSALEEAVEELRRQSTALVPHRDWIQRVVGSVIEIEAFDEVLAFGRQIRKADLSDSEGNR